MRNRSYKFVFFFILFSFAVSLVRTTGFSAFGLNEEELVETEKVGDKECDDELTYAFELISHETENSDFEEKNACLVNRILASNYAEPSLENSSYPPEKAV
jgi:hypothetical protein